MDRSLVRISSLFLLVILINHIVLPTNARVISGTTSASELEACPPSDEIATSLMGEEPAPSFTEVEVTSKSNVVDSQVNTDEIAACPPKN
ncbi:hypothetical protein DCAR_0727906 [Daucus carota subsp. sativus]|uniref:Uncharacterized protein n=1 Tax=Daucus carota subsp. sativus TaxID=79200 RepID=A0A175YA50_DAUCS|nr:hypothetical protein DCAR_0727906 [Daucus carota subsp. sativus]